MSATDDCDSASRLFGTSLARMSASGDHRHRENLTGGYCMGRQPSSTPVGWWVYIARCADGSLYTGITTDPARRLTQHNAGTASKYTRARRPVTFVYQEPHPTRSQALSRESAIKALTRRAKEALVAA